MKHTQRISMNKTDTESELTMWEVTYMMESGEETSLVRGYKATVRKAHNSSEPTLVVFNRDGNIKTVFNEVISVDEVIS